MLGICVRAILPGSCICDYPVISISRQFTHYLINGQLQMMQFLCVTILTGHLDSPVNSVLFVCLMRFIVCQRTILLGQIQRHEKQRTENPERPGRGKINQWGNARTDRATHRPGTAVLDHVIMLLQ